MISGTQPVRFWHFADLHLGLHEASCDEPCHSCIAGKVLDALTRELVRLGKARRPDLILFAGDIFNLPKGARHWAPTQTKAFLRPAAEPLERFLLAADGVEIVGVVGDRLHDPSAAAIFRALGWRWVHEGPTHHVELGSGRSVAVAHRPEPPPGAEDASYCALGHLHSLRQWRRAGDRLWAACPGHLVSRWDGPGKAWPTYFIEGAISPDGDVEISPRALEEEPFWAPATRQIYADPVRSGRSRGTLTLVHAPREQAFYQKHGLGEALVEVVPHPDPFGPACARFRYGSAKQMEDIIAAVARSCPGDVFVPPAPKGSCRAVYYGRSIWSFWHFVSQVHKRHDNVQTSDRYGWPRAQRSTGPSAAPGRDHLDEASSAQRCARKQRERPICAGYK